MIDLTLKQFEALNRAAIGQVIIKGAVAHRNAARLIELGLIRCRHVRGELWAQATPLGRRISKTTRMPTNRNRVPIELKIAVGE